MKSPSAVSGTAPIVAPTEAKVRSVHYRKHTEAKSRPPATYFITLHYKWEHEPTHVITASIYGPDTGRGEELGPPPRLQTSSASNSKANMNLIV